MSRRVVVAGAGMGGLRAAEQLRAAGWAGAITVVGAEPHPPYNRPPLSKGMLVSPDDDASVVARVAFRRRASTHDVDWRLGTAIEAASLADRTVRLADGTELRYDGLVAATGLRPRRLPVEGAPERRFVLRTVDDALALRAELAPGRHLVVVGGGFIGCEVAATACAMGCRVSVIEPTSAPMSGAIGQPLATALQRYLAARGIRFHVGETVRAVHHSGHRTASVELSSGARLNADVVVESIGSHPNVEWLQGNGLDLSDGLCCDNEMRVEGRPDLVAVGDVARFPNPRFDDVPRRVEHWCVPGDTAKRAAATLVGHLTGSRTDQGPFAPLPSFWSDQFDLRIQGFGAPGVADEIDVMEGDLDRIEAGVAVGYRRDGDLVAAVLLGLPANRHAHYRSLLNRLPQAA